MTVLPGDSVETYDLGQRRVTTFAPDWKPVRTVDVGTGALEMARLENGSRVIAGYRYEPERVGLPLHLIDPQGKMTISFGAQPPVSDLRNLHLFYRHVAHSVGQKTVWSSHVLRYRLEEWSTDGRLAGVLERRPPWFTAGQRYGYIDAEQAPAAGIAAIHINDAGIIWVIIHVPDTDWKEGLGATEDPYGRTYMGIARYDDYFDTVIEAIDPIGGRILGSRRMDDYAIGFTDDGLLFGYREAENGEPYIPIWAVQTSGNM